MSEKKRKKDHPSAGQPERAPAPDEQASAGEVSESPASEVTQEQLNHEIADLQGRLQRLGADYQNYQKRSQRQIEQAVTFAREDMARALLAVLDNFDHTLQKGRETTDANALLEGIRIVHDHLFNTLATLGLAPMPVAPGDEFDPSRHEAMLHESTADVPEGCVVRELARGYVMNDRTLRPAKVSVAKAPEPVEPDASSDDAS